MWKTVWFGSGSSARRLDSDRERNASSIESSINLTSESDSPVDEKDLITLTISGMALVVAIYGILERGLATRRALRLRLTELIDSLARIDTEQQVYAQDASKSDGMKTAFQGSNTTRRALLAAQAVDILSKYRRRITIPEYVVLATALHQTSDTAGERGVLAQAVADLRKETPFQRAAAWRTWAWFNFGQGEFETGRLAIRRSLDAMPPVDDVRRLDKFDNIMSWFEFESYSGRTAAAQVHTVLDEAEAVLGTVKNDEWRVAPGERLRRARERLATTQLMSGPRVASPSGPLPRS